MNNKPGVILLVEDDEGHAIIAMRCFKEVIGANKVYWVKDGEEALDYLFHTGKYTDKEKSPQPDLVLLDLQLPKLGGHEVLRAIKESEDLRIIPVIVLTSSENEADVLKAYSNYANSYLVKPQDFKMFRQMIRDTSTYWLMWNKQCKGINDHNRVTSLPDRERQHTGRACCGVWYEEIRARGEDRVHGSCGLSVRNQIGRRSWM